MWFGEAVSLAEILTGTYFAPLGFLKGLFAIIIGHIIGCSLLFLAGVIGARTQKSAMDTVKISFGSRGSNLFVILNVVQLVGWTAIMIFDGAVAANELWNIGQSLWTVVIGMLIILWILIGIKNLGKLNMITMSALLILTVVMSVAVCSTGRLQNIGGEAMSFGAAVELSVAMPLSWLPLMSDYTKDARTPIKTPLVGALVYGVVSGWMYVIGMSATIATGESDIAQIMMKAGIGVVGLVIIVLSTVTTTFLDAYSAGLSFTSIFAKANAKWIAVGTAGIGMMGAIFLPLHDITEFLYFIGSVFAPMTAILMTDFFILKKDVSKLEFQWSNMVTWVIGFVVYRCLMTTDMIIGNTIPSVMITSAICILIHKAQQRLRKK